jgi:zinc transporter ZupT
VTGWMRVSALSRTADTSFAVGLAVALGIAAAHDSESSRVASTLGGLGGLWMIAAGFMRIAFQAWAPERTRAVGVTEYQVATGLALAVLGALIVSVVWRLATSVRDDFDDEDDDSREPAEPVQPAEVS